MLSRLFLVLVARKGNGRHVRVGVSNVIQQVEDVDSGGHQAPKNHHSEHRGFGRLPRYSIERQCDDDAGNPRKHVGHNAQTE